MAEFSITNTSPFTVADNTASVTATISLTKPGETPIQRTVTRIVPPTDTTFESMGVFLREYTEFANSINKDDGPDVNVLDFEGRSFAFTEDETPGMFIGGSAVYDGINYGTNLNNLGLTFLFKGITIKNVNLNLGKKVSWTPISKRPGAYKAAGVNLDINGFKNDGTPDTSKLNNVLWLNDWNHPNVLVTPKITPSQQRLDGDLTQNGLPEPPALINKHSYTPNGQKWVTLSSSMMEPRAGEEGGPAIFGGVVITDTEKVEELNAILQTSPDEITNRIIWIHSGPNLLYPNMIANWTVNPDGTGQLDYVFEQSGASYSINSGYLNIGVACTSQEFIENSRPGEYHYDFSKGFTNVDVYYHPEYSETPDAYVPVLNVSLFRARVTQANDDADNIFDNCYISGSFSGLINTIPGDDNIKKIINSRIQYMSSCGGDEWANNVLRCFTVNGGGPSLAVNNYIELAINQSLIRPSASAVGVNLIEKGHVLIEGNYFNQTGTVHGQPVSLYGFSFLNATLRNNVFHNTERPMSFQGSYWNDETIYDPSAVMIVENNLFINDRDYYEGVAGQGPFSLNQPSTTHDITYLPTMIWRNNSLFGGENKIAIVDFDARQVYSTAAFGSSSLDYTNPNNFTTEVGGSPREHFLESVSRVNGEFRLGFRTIHDRNLFLKTGHWFQMLIGSVTTAEIHIESVQIIDDTTVRIIPTQSDIDAINSELSSLPEGQNPSINFRYRGLEETSGGAWVNIFFYNNIASSMKAVHPTWLFEREVGPGEAGSDPSGDFILDEPINNRQGVAPPLGSVSAFNYYYQRADNDPLAGTNQSSVNFSSYSRRDIRSVDIPDITDYATGIDYDNCRLFDDSVGANAASDGGQPGIRWNIMPTRADIQNIYNNKNQQWFSQFGGSSLQLTELPLTDENRVFYDTDQVTYRETR